MLLIHRNSFGMRAGCGLSSSDAGESCVHAVFLKFVKITRSYSHSRIFCLFNLPKSKLSGKFWSWISILRCALLFLNSPGKPAVSSMQVSSFLSPWIFLEWNSWPDKVNHKTPIDFNGGRISPLICSGSWAVEIIDSLSDSLTCLPVFSCL